MAKMVSPLPRTITSDCTVDKARENITELSEDFFNLLQYEIVGLLQDNFETSQKTGYVNVTMEWTNNNCESFNYVLMQATDWKTKKLSI